MVGSIRLRGNAGSLISQGILTVYSKWVSRADARPGEAVNIYLGDECIATGLYEGVGAVAVRIIGWECGLDPSETVLENLREAYKLRSALPLRSNAYRLVNSEGDMLPGLIVDVYNDIAVVQSGSLGMDRMLSVVADGLEELLHPRLIYGRHDQRSRRRVGLPVSRGVMRGSGPPRTTIREGEAVFRVDVERGQKTGLFLDQRDNRLMLASLIRGGERVLDLYSYTGGFGIHALLSGASSATMVEESEWAVGEAERNLSLNGLEGKARIINMRVEDFLSQAGENYDVVVVDPPALIPSKDLRAKGLKTYRKLYCSALPYVRRGGLLVASSCSYFLSLDDMLAILSECTGRLGVQARILRVAEASIDHVWRPADKHLRYLKTIFARVF